MQIWPSARRMARMPDHHSLRPGDTIRLLCVPEGDRQQRERELQNPNADMPGWTADTIERYSWDIQAWFGFIPSFVKPSLILDGCNVGDGEEGRALIDRLYHLTGCHITCRQSSAPRHLQLV